MIKHIRKLVVVVGIACMLAGVAQACPTCKESIGEHGGNLVQGYFWSIIFMMSMPFLILSGLASMFYLDVRRARKRQELEAAGALGVGTAS